MFLCWTPQLEGMEELKAKTLPIDTAGMDLFSSLEDGVLLCGLLVALLGEDTVDPRAVNWEGMFITYFSLYSVYMQSMFSLYSVYMQSICSLYAVYMQSMFSLCSVYVQSMFSVKVSRSH